jgi:hypothetical protein
MTDWELRSVRALLYDEEWVYNETFHHKYIYINKGDDAEAVFWYECKLLYNPDFLKECEVVSDNDVYELVIKRTNEPILMMCMTE